MWRRRQQDHVVLRTQTRRRFADGATAAFDSSKRKVCEPSQAGSHFETAQVGNFCGGRGLARPTFPVGVDCTELSHRAPVFLLRLLAEELKGKMFGKPTCDITHAQRR
jgi:hypothetical protein